MLSAKDAYRLATENKKREISKRIEDIARTIETAVNKGKYETYYSYEIEKEVEQILYEEGYKVKNCSNPIDGTEYMISWKF